MSDQNAALVHARFVAHTILNEAKSKEAGRPIYDEMEVCELRYAGNRLTVGVFPAHEMCEWVEDPETRMRTRITYAQKYNQQYLAFKDGKAQAASGTPLEELPFLSAGKRLELKAIHINTAEALAALDGQPLKQLGMGGRELKDKAQLYLDNAAELSTLEGLKRENERLKAELEASKDGNWLADKPKRGSGKTKAKDDAENPFLDATFSDDDIRAWLTDAGVQFDQGLSREELAELANDTNKKLSKQTKAA